MTFDQITKAPRGTVFATTGRKNRMRFVATGWNDIVMFFSGKDFAPAVPEIWATAEFRPTDETFSWSIS